MKKLVQPILTSIMIGSFVIAYACKPMGPKKEQINRAGGDLSAVNIGPGKFEKDFKNSDSFFSLMSAPKVGNSPHGKVQIWYSSNIRDTISQESFRVPTGSVSIKEFKTDNDEGLVVMVKMPAGYDRQNSDWHYEVRDTSGELRSEPAPGKIAMCIGCHTNAEPTDFLAGTSFGIDTTDSNRGNFEGDFGGKGPGAFAADFKSSEQFFTKMQGTITGDSPHKDVQIWYSSNLTNLIEQPNFRAPVGSVAIKEFNNDDSPGHNGAAVMVKMESGYDTENGDWYYEMRDKYGALMSDPSPGKITMCIGCHSSANNTDYLAGTSLGSTTTRFQPPGEFKNDYASSDVFFTQMSKSIEGNSPHGNTRIWYSSNIRQLISQNNFTVPNGSVAIKRFQNQQGSGHAVMMKKEAGYDSDNNDWHYEVRDSYGNLLDDPPAGTIGMCISCHAKSADADYLTGVDIRN